MHEKEGMLIYSFSIEAELLVAWQYSRTLRRDRPLDTQRLIRSHFSELGPSHADAPGDLQTVLPRYFRHKRPAIGQSALNCPAHGNSRRNCSIIVPFRWKREGEKERRSTPTKKQINSARAVYPVVPDRMESCRSNLDGICFIAAYLCDDTFVVIVTYRLLFITPYFQFVPYPFLNNCYSLVWFCFFFYVTWNT